MPTKCIWFKIWTRAQPRGTAWSNVETKEDNNNCSTQLHVALSHGTAEDGPEVEYKLTADKASKTTFACLITFQENKNEPKFPVESHYVTYLPRYNKCKWLFFKVSFSSCRIPYHACVKWFAGLQTRLVTTFTVSHSPEMIFLSGNWTHRSWVWTL